MPIVTAYGSEFIAVTAGNKLTATSRSRYKVYQWVSDTGIPPAWRLIANVNAVEYEGEVVTKATQYRVDASDDVVQYQTTPLPTPAGQGLNYAYINGRSVVLDEGALELYHDGTGIPSDDVPDDDFVLYDGSAATSYAFEHRILSSGNYADYDPDANYYIFSSDTEDYYVWYNIDGAGADPAIPGRTGLELILTAGSGADNSVKEEALLNTVAGITVTRIAGAVIDISIDNPVEVKPASVSKDTNFDDVIFPTSVGGVKKWFGFGPDESFASGAGIYSTRFGVAATAEGEGSVALGNYAQASLQGGIAIGLNAYAEDISGIAIGEDSHVGAQASQAIGNRAHALGRFTTALGQRTQALSESGIAIGNESICEGLSGLAIGNTALISGDNGIAIGDSSLSEGEGSIVIGEGAVNTGAAATFCTVVGTEATCDFTLGVAIGYQSAANSVANVSIGYQAITGGAVSIAVGNLTNTGTSSSNIALGHVVTIGAAFASCICLGNVSNPTASNQMVVGSGANPINTMYLGKGVQTGTAPTATTISATEGTGTNIGGGILNIRGGVGTGNSTPGALRLQSATAGASGTAKQTAVTRIEVNGTGIGFFTAAPVAKQTITGSRAGNAALASLLTALNTMGFVTNSTSA